jgi:hypothetical protein
MLDGLAGGLQPWWHYLNAYHEDRRMYHTAEPVYRWHKANEEYLRNRRPVATVGVVWSQRNVDFYGRDDAELLVELPWRGIAQALIRARIPWLPVHADDLERDAGQFSALILPNLAAMSDSQIKVVRGFVARGGGLIATGQSSLFDEWGDARADFALGDLFGAHVAGTLLAASESARHRLAAETTHSYLRLTPELRARVDGPHMPGEPPVAGKRHTVLRGFEETDILPFGGVLEPLKVDSGAQVLLTYVPSFPVFPPEASWMREPKTEVPGLILNASTSGSRIAFLPADLDRRYARDILPDHGNLLANLIRWAAKDSMPLVVDGHGLVDCHLYYQANRFVLHLVNLTNAGTWRQPVDELMPIGPMRLRVKLPDGARGTHLRLLVADKALRGSMSKGWSTFEIASVLEHEVVVSNG